MRLKGVGILGNSPEVRGKAKGSLGVGLPSLENISWFVAACLYINCERGAPSTIVIDIYYNVTSDY